MASLLFTVDGAVVNALAFSGTNSVFSRLTDHGAEECKRHDLSEERLQRARDKRHEDRIKRLHFINKRLREKNEAKAYINNVDEAILEYYCVFGKKLSLRHLSLSYQNFIIHQRHKKMVNYYLLQWAQALQHMHYTNTLNK